ncbi:MAG TPA: rhodanese-like domain-containing protein [Ktedonobacteraceae bacterium]|nr:rhodanese-like domain-containing protein [Ktedonobacteraceae bacterium]
MIATIAIASPLEAQKHLNEAATCIIDARPYQDYTAGHIPGALWMGWDAWCERAPAHAGQILAQPGYWGVLREGAMESFHVPLRQTGLRDERPVLVYADGSKSKGREARIAWMLLYLGIPSVSLLNGGWSAWLKYGGSSDVATPTPDYGLFTIHVQEHRRIRLQQLRQDLQGNSAPLLIDARSQAEFAGQCHVYQPRMGRLPGAVHMPYTDLFDESGCYVTQNVYLQRLPSEVRSAERCVAYCEVGVRSCLFALLHELYTGKVVANFDGSFMQWAFDRTLPIESDTA